MKLSRFLDIVTDQFNVERVCSIHTFSELGADSLDMVELVVNIEDEIGIDLPDSILEEEVVGLFYAQVLKQVNYGG